MSHVHPTLIRYGMAGAFGAALAGGPLLLAGTPALPGGIPSVQRMAESQKEKDAKIGEIYRIIPHLDHSIDILSKEAPDPKHRRSAALKEVRNARDELQREVDEYEHANAGRDIKKQHERDKESEKKGAPKTDYEGLQIVAEYLRNSRLTLERQSGDPHHHRGNALAAMKRAEKNIQTEMDEYPASRRR